MSPFGNEEIVGYQLITDGGDIYCYGETDFQGTIKQNFELKHSIIGSLNTPKGQHLVVENGDYYIVGPTIEKDHIEVFEDSVVASIFFNNEVVVLTKHGKFYKQSGNTMPKLETDDELIDINFVACSITNTGDDIIAVTENGKIYSTDKSLISGDLHTLVLEHVRVVDVVCHPTRNGYWLLDSIGGIFCFGTVDYFGSVPEDGIECIATQLVVTPSGSGYLIVDQSGMVLPYGNAIFFGAPKASQVTGRIVSLDIWKKPVKATNANLFDKLVQNDINQLLGKDVEFISEPSARID